MLHIDATFEDNRVVITRDCTTTTAEERLAGLAKETTNKWNGIIVDSLSGKSVNVSWTDDQVSAILALANGLGESLLDTNKQLVDDLYAIAEPCFHQIGDNHEDTFPSECRLIP